MISQFLSSMVYGKMKVFKSVYLNLIIPLIGISVMLAITFTPSSLKFIKNSEYIMNLSTTLESKVVGDSAIVLFVSSIPSIIEICLDVVTGDLSKSNGSFLLGRVLILVIAFLFGLQYLLRSNRYLLIDDSFALSFFFSTCCFVIVVGSSIYFMLHDLKPQICSLPLTLALNFMITSMIVLRFYSFFYETTNRALCIAQTVQTIVYFPIVFFVSLNWVRKLWSNRFVIENSICLFYVVAGFNMFIGMYGVWIASVIAGNDGTFLKMTDSEIAGIIYVFAFCIIILNMVPGRIARLDALASKDHIIETKKKYVRYISHELRNPLNAILMGIKLSLELFPPTDDVSTDLIRKQTLNETYSACEAAIDILNELLLYDKIDNNILTLSKQKVNILDLVSSSIEIYRSQLADKQIEINVANHVSDCKAIASKSDSFQSNTYRSVNADDCIYVDKSKICQVIRNIVSNAIKFTPNFQKIDLFVYFKPIPQSKSLNRFQKRLSIGNGFAMFQKNKIHSESKYQSTDLVATSTQLSGSLIIEVKDNGVGISEENQKLLFDNIVQFNPELVQDGGGSGLGMWISKNIMNLHQGEIRVYSEGEGKGSTFTIELPMERGNRIDSNASISYESASRNSFRNLPLDPRSSNIKYFIAGSDQFPSSRLHNTRKSAQSLDDCLEIKGTVVDVRQVTKKKISDTDTAVTANCSTKSLNILIVDDSPLNRKMLSRLLKMKGHRCTEMTDGLQALNHMRHILSCSTPKNRTESDLFLDSKAPDHIELSSINPNKGEIIPDSLKVNESEKTVYDVILMDSMMPNMEGPEATKEIIKLGYSGPIIGVTGNAMQLDLNSFMEAGVKKVLTKPLDIDKLTETFQEYHLL